MISVDQSQNRAKVLISIRKDLKEEVEKLIAGFGGKLSPLIERLLEGFVDSAKLNPSSLVLKKEEQIKKLKSMEKKVQEQIKKLEVSNQS